MPAIVTRHGERPAEEGVEGNALRHKACAGKLAYPKGLTVERDRLLTFRRVVNGPDAPIDRRRAVGREFACERP
jgi:hypothetical protein